jgi:hypothetical protein
MEAWTKEIVAWAQADTSPEGYSVCLIIEDLPVTTSKQLGPSALSRLPSLVIVKFLQNYLSSMRDVSKQSDDSCD